MDMISIRLKCSNEYGSITIQMIQIFDQLKIENERDWTLKISSAVEN